MYRDILGREADQSGLNYWLSDLEMNKVGLESVRINLSTSNEAKIRSYYLKHLKKEPDQMGLDAWISDNKRNKADLVRIREQIRSSSECMEDCL